MESVYVETSVIGHLVGHLRNDPVVAGRQVSTREWWRTEANRYQLLVSQVVVDECSEGDTEAAAERLEAIEGLDFTDATESSELLAIKLTQRGAVPATEPRDAAHIAIAAVNNVKYLLTWNFKHIANAAMREKIEAVCREAGYEPPLICTPDELTERGENT